MERIWRGIGGVLIANWEPRRSNGSAIAMGGNLVIRASPPRRSGPQNGILERAQEPGWTHAVTMDGLDLPKTRCALAFIYTYTYGRLQSTNECPNLAIFQHEASRTAGSSCDIAQRQHTQESTSLLAMAVNF